HPDETDAAERDERPAPADQRDEPRDNRRRDGVAETGEGVRDALREAAPAGRRPHLHRARRDRKRRTFADADEQANEKQRDDPGNRASEDRGGRPDEAAQEERPAGTDAIANPAAKDLKEKVRIGERRQHDAELR